jgi:hypothetical protein
MGAKNTSNNYSSAVGIEMEDCRPDDKFIRVIL